MDDRKTLLLSEEGFLLIPEPDAEPAQSSGTKLQYRCSLQ